MPLPAITFKTSKLKQFAENVIKDKEAVSELRPFWEFLWEKYIVGEIKEIFETDGYGTWPERTSGGSWPLLRRSGGFPRGRLYRSYTQVRLSSNINIRTDEKYEFGSALPYAPYHERDRKYVPARPVINLLYDRLGGGVGAGRIEELFGQYFINGVVDRARFTSREQSQLTRRTPRGGRGGGIIPRRR